MISGVQSMLPKGHEYTEKTSISTDGLRVWNQQLSRGYELQYDKNGKLITNEVAINGDAINNELGIDVNQGNFDNIRVTNNKDFEKVKKALIPYLEKFGLTEENIRNENGTVFIDLPVLRSKTEIKNETPKTPITTPTPSSDISGEVSALGSVEPTQPALRDVESTAKALEDKKSSLDEKAKKLGYIGIKQFNAQNQLNENLTDAEKALLQEYSDFQQEIKNLKDENVIAKLSDDEFSSWSKANDITRNDLGKVVKDEEIELAAKRIRILNARGDSKKAESELKKLKESKKKDNWTIESWKERFDEDVEQSEIDDINSSNKEFNKSIDKAVESLLSKQLTNKQNEKVNTKENNEEPMLGGLPTNRDEAKGGKTSAELRTQTEKEVEKPQSGIKPTETEQTIPDKVTQLRAAEQAEYDAKIPNAEKYRVDGKVDRDLLTNDKDRAAYDEIYDRYDKLITPSIREQKASEPIKSDKNYQQAQEANSIIAKENPEASVLLTPKGNDLSLTAIYVGKDKRGKGIGSKVLESVKKQADKLGKKVVLDATNELDAETDLERLGKFYEKNGFEKVGENKYEYNPKEKAKSKTTPLQKEQESKPIALPKENDSVTLEVPNRLPKKMVFKDGFWKQKVGNEFTEVGKQDQEAAQAKFDEQNKTTTEKAIRKGVKEVQKNALEYKKSVKNKSVASEPVLSLFEKVSKMMADAYSKVKNEPTKEEVKESYDALVEETNAQYDFIVAKGLKVVKYEGIGEPYEDSSDMLKDLRENNTLKFLPNKVAFGQEANKAIDNIGLLPSGRKLADGYELTNSEVFRVVHDYFGHGILGNQFGAIGEENATLQHLDLYSDIAALAVIFQTRGQNSWVNFSGENTRANELRTQAREFKKQGKKAEAKKLLEEADKIFKFAEPKIGIFPNIFNFKKYESARRINEQELLNSKSDKRNNDLPELLATYTNKSSKTRGINKRNVREVKRIGLFNVNVVAEYTLDDKINEGIKKAFPQFKGVQKIYEITNGDVYKKMLVDSLKDQKFAASVTIHSVEDFNNMRMFITEDGSTGITITKEGFLGGAFSAPNNNKPQNIAQLMVLGIKEGALTAECFATILPDYYANFGFKAVAKTAFNDEYKPMKANGKSLIDWDYETYKEFNEGRPDVVFLIYDGGDRNTIEDRLGQFDSYENYDKANAESFDKNGYEKAQNLMQQSAIKRAEFDLGIETDVKETKTDESPIFDDKNKTNNKNETGEKDLGNGISITKDSTSEGFYKIYKEGKFAGLLGASSFVQANNKGQIFDEKIMSDILTQLGIEHSKAEINIQGENEFLTIRTKGGSKSLKVLESLLAKEPTKLTTTE
jgi:GNAT superfamily N-acetyltransferase